MNIEIIRTIILSVLPISELRGAIPYALSHGLNPFLAFALGVIFNSLIMFPVFLFLDYFHGFFMQFNTYKKLFVKYIGRSRKKLEKHIGTNFEFWAILFLVGIPLPFTGAYTGSILSWFFGLERKKTFLAIFLGVTLAGIVVTLISLGVINFFN